MTVTESQKLDVLARRVERTERVMAERLADALVDRDIAERLDDRDQKWVAVGSVVALVSALYNLTGRAHDEIEADAKRCWRVRLQWQIDRLYRALDPEYDYDLDEPQREALRHRLAVMEAMAAEYDEANTGVAL